MLFGIVLTDRDPAAVADLAVLAEETGWDGIFSWETLYGLDPWVGLTAAATRTSRVRLGTMLTPMTKYKPWHLASVALTLDALSGGRVVLSIGLGAITEGWTAYEADPGRRARAELTDEGLDVMFGLWGGPGFAYEGKHYTISPTQMNAPPRTVQVRDRVTTWCVGRCGSRRSMGRAARCDGLLPDFAAPPGEPPTDVRTWHAAAREIAEVRAAQGRTGAYDIVAEGDFPLGRWDEARDFAAALADGGYTWYLDSYWSAMDAPDERARIEARITAGPPR